MAWLDGWDNRLEYTIDNNRIGEDLVDFPGYIVVSSGIGRNNFDGTVVFDELIYVSSSGVAFEDDFTESNGEGWDVISGNMQIDPTYYLRFNDDGLVTTSGSYYAEDWEITFRMYQGSSGGGNSHCQFWWNNDYPTDNTRFGVVIQRYSSLNYAYLLYRIGGVDTNILSTTKYNYNSLSGWFSFRIKKEENIFYFKHWYQTESEPSVWDNVVTENPDTNFPTSGRLTFQTNNSSSAGIDDIVLTNNTIKGYDKKIAVTDYTGINQLYTEIEHWSWVHKRAALWTKIPTVASGTDTKVYLYYDKEQLNNDVYVGYTGTAPAAKVWNDDYLGVWHLAGQPDNTADSLKDSSNEGNNGTSVNMDGGADSLVHNKFTGIDTDGVNEYVQCGNDPSLRRTADFSVECVFKTTDFSSDAIVAKTDSDNTKGWGTKVRTTNNIYLGFKISNSHYTAYDGSTTLSPANFYYFGFSYVGDGTTPVALINDNIETLSVVSSAGSGGINGFTDSGQNFEIGAGNIFTSSQTYHEGPLVEVRYSSGIRSPAWMSATYYTSFDNLMTVAAGGTAPPPSPPEPPWQDDWSDFLELITDKNKVEEDLANFPILVTLSSGVGINNFDSSGVFEALAEPDGVDSYTSLMLDPGGDQSIHRHDISFTNAPTITTVSGIDCVSLNGTNQYMNCPDHSSWDMPGDFCHEVWVNMPSAAFTKFNNIYTHGNVFSVDGAWVFGIGYNVAWTGVRISVAWRVSGTTASFQSDDLTGTIQAGKWHHVAFVRSSGVIYLYFDGQEVGDYTMSDPLVAAASYLLRIGRVEHTTSETFQGYMAGIRISDTDRYTTTFTPSMFYTNDEYTRLLYNVASDKSQYKHELVQSVGGSYTDRPAIHRSTPAVGDNGYWFLQPTAAPEANIQIPDHSAFDFGSGDFTIEFWFNTIQYTGDNRYFLTKRVTTDYMYIVILHTNTGNINTTISFNGTSWAVSDSMFVPAGEWYHYALTREGNTFRIFLNGILQHSQTAAGSVLNEATPLVIGAGDSAGYKGYWGYLQGFKISKGIARYTSKFVPSNPPEGTSWYNRKKIQFADADHNRLYAEIERWDHANRQAWIHVSVPVIDNSTDTLLYMYYDKAQPDSNLYVGDILDTPAKEVWNNDFVGVWHMTLSDYVTTKSFPDSTIHTNAGEPTATLNPLDLTEGLTTPAMNWDGTAQYLGIIDDDSLDVTTNYTVEAYFRPTADNTVTQLMSKTNNDTNGFQLRGDGSSGPQFMTGTGTVSGRNNWQSYGWQYAAGVCTTTSAILYLDGEKHGEVATTGTPVNTYTLYLGARWDAYYFEGDIAEMRISNTARSESWTKATYHSLFDNLITYRQGVRPVYTASGTTTVDGLLTGGIPVRLYRRVNGDLVGSTISEPDGTFVIDSTHNEEHYVTALYTASGTNALIYDWIAP